MTTTDGMERQATAGHHWVWRLTAFVEPLCVWEVLTPDDIGRPCRYGVRPGEQGCGDAAVARLNLAGENAWPQWAYYCEAHLFSRRIIDGMLHTCVLEPIPVGEAA